MERKKTMIFNRYHEQIEGFIGVLSIVFGWISSFQVGGYYIAQRIYGLNIKSFTGGLLVSMVFSIVGIFLIVLKDFKHGFLPIIGTVLCLISFVYVARNGYDDFPILRIYKYLVAFIGVANTIVYVGKREES